MKLQEAIQIINKAHFMLNENSQPVILIASDTFYFTPDSPITDKMIESFTASAKANNCIDCKIVKLNKLATTGAEMYDVAVAFNLKNKKGLKALQRSSHSKWRSLEAKSKMFFHSGLENLNFIYKTNEISKIVSNANSKAVRQLQLS